MDTLLLITQIIIGVALIAVGITFVLSKVRQEERDGLLDLATARGETNKDLRAEIEDLRREVAELRGALQAVQNMKTTEIADLAAEKTAERLLPFLVDHQSRIAGGGQR